MLVFLLGKCNQLRIREVIKKFDCRLVRLYLHCMLSTFVGKIKQQMFFFFWLLDLNSTIHLSRKFGSQLEFNAFLGGEKIKLK